MLDKGLGTSKEAFDLAALRANRDKRPYAVAFIRGRYYVNRLTYRRWREGKYAGLAVFPEGNMHCRCDHKIDWTNFYGGNCPKCGKPLDFGGTTMTKNEANIAKLNTVAAEISTLIPYLTPRTARNMEQCKVLLQMVIDSILDEEKPQEDGGQVQRLRTTLIRLVTGVDDQPFAGCEPYDGLVDDAMDEAKTLIEELS